MTVTSFEEQALSGFAHTLADWPDATELTQYSDDPAEIYDPANGVGIYLYAFPQSFDTLASPAIKLTDYVVTDSPSNSDSVLGIQVEIWSADVSQLNRIAGDLFNLFQGRQRGMLGSVMLVMALRTSGAILGIDTNGRRGRTENYYLTLHRPSLNR